MIANSKRQDQRKFVWNSLLRQRGSNSWHVKYGHDMGKLMGGPNLVTGASTGCMRWRGFIAPTYLVNKLFAGHGLQIWAIEIGNHLINVLLFGAILGAWQ